MHQLLPSFLYLDVSRDLESALPGTYNWMLVALSVMIAYLAAYAALGETPRGEPLWGNQRLACVNPVVSLDLHIGRITFRNSPEI